MEKMRNVYIIVVRKSEGKELFGRPRHRWNDIRMDLKGVKVWTELFRLRIEPVVGCCKHDNVPSGSIKSGKFLD
jgi:hypothetical protein